MELMLTIKVDLKNFDEMTKDREKMKNRITVEVVVGLVAEKALRH